MAWITNQQMALLYSSPHLLLLHDCPVYPTSGRWIKCIKSCRGMLCLITYSPYTSAHKRYNPMWSCTCDGYFKAFDHLQGRLFSIAYRFLCRSVRRAQIAVSLSSVHVVTSALKSSWIWPPWTVHQKRKKWNTMQLETGKRKSHVSLSVCF